MGVVLMGCAVNKADGWSSGDLLCRSTLCSYLPLSRPYETSDVHLIFADALMSMRRRYDANRVRCRCEIAAVECGRLVKAKENEEGKGSGGCGRQLQSEKASPLRMTYHHQASCNLMKDLPRKNSGSSGVRLKCC